MKQRHPRATARADSPMFWEPSAAFLKWAIALILGSCGVFLIVLFIIAPEQMRTIRAVDPLALSLVAMVAWILLSRGKIRTSVYVFGAGVWVYATGTSFLFGGMDATFIIAYPLIIIVMGWLLGPRTAIAFTALTVAACLGFYQAEVRGFLPLHAPTDPVLKWIVQTTVFTFSALLIAYIARSYGSRIEEVRKLGKDLALRSAEVQAREADLNRAQAVAQVGSWVYDPVTDVMHMSAEACRIFGVPEGTKGNRDSYIPRVHPEDRDTLDRLWQTALFDGEIIDIEHRILVGKTIRWVRHRAEPELDADGKPLRSVGTTQDITESKRATDALQESEARFRSLSEMSSDFYWESDAAHRLTARDSANKKLSTVSMFQRGAQIGERRWELPYLSPDEAGWQAHRAVLEAHLPFRDFELSRLGADGSERHISISGDPVFDASGEFRGYRGVGTDITERKQAEARLRLAASVFDHAHEAITITDAGGNIVSVNRRFTEITGYSADEAIGSNPRLLKSGRHGSDFYQTMWASIHTDGYWTGEVWNRRKDGRVFPEWLSICVVRDERGRVSNYVGTFVDISQRIAAEQALRQREHIYRTMFQCAPGGVWMIGPDRRTTEVNQRLCDLLGHTREDMLGRDPIEFADEENARIYEGKSNFGSGRGMLRYEVALRHRDGHNIAIEVNANTLLNEDGSVMGGLGFIVDLSERKRHEDELQRLNQELEQRVLERTQALATANKELESFSYSVSHDLRAPLRAIHGFSRLVEQQYAGQIDEQGRGMLARVSAGAEKMAQLIDDLLRLAQISRQAMRTGPVDLSALAWEVIGNLQLDAPERRIEWVIAPQVTALGDPGLLRVALQNLIGNAWKYSSKRASARIEFGTSEEHDRPVYFVRDNGAGFDMAYAKNLFGAFQRLHSAAEFPGTGIGLATVSRILQRHSGKIWVEGQVDRGATFYFSLGLDLARPAAPS